MDHTAPHVRHLQAAHRALALALACLVLAAAALSGTQAYSQSGDQRGTLLCAGALAGPSTIEWGKSTLEFALDYGPGVVTPLESDLEALNTSVAIELDERFLRATEAQTRMPTAEGNLLRITELQVSRQTGRFTLQATLVRESSGAPAGASTWEGTCTPKAAQPRKF